MSSQANTVTAIDSKKPTTKQELVAANIKLLIEQLEAGHSEALTNYPHRMSCLHQLQLWKCAGDRAADAHRDPRRWILDLEELRPQCEGRTEGHPHSRPLIVVAFIRKKVEEAQKDITKQNERVLLGFRNAYVFDVSQTDGVELPALHEVSGDPGGETSTAWPRAPGSPREIQLVYNSNIAPALGSELRRTDRHPAGPIQGRRVFDPRSRDGA